jgi:hypothetical protein
MTNLARVLGIVASLLGVLMAGAGSPAVGAATVPTFVSGITPNGGSFPRDLLAFAQAPGLTHYFLKDRILIESYHLEGDFPADAREVARRVRSFVVGIRFEGCQPAREEFLGDAPGACRWVTSEGGRLVEAVPRASTGIVYRDLYPGVDFVSQIIDERVRFHFALNPGADPGAIGLVLEWVDSLRVNEEGLLVGRGPDGTLQASPPRAFQLSGAANLQKLPVAFRVDSEARVRFDVASIPAPLGLRIEFELPMLETTSFIGPWIFLDEEREADGRTIVGGMVPSLRSSGEWTPGVMRPVEDWDAFVAWSSSEGALARQVILSGSGFDAATAVSFGATGEIVLGGITDSPDFPTTTGAWDERASGGLDGFVASVPGDGSGLSTCTLIGGSADDAVTDLALDAQGGIVLFGTTSSSDFPTTPGAFDPTYNGGGDVFLAKLASGLSYPIYATFLGVADAADAPGELVLAEGGNPDLAALSSALRSVGPPGTEGTGEATAVARSGETGDEEHPDEIALLPIEPNPSNPACEVRFVVPGGGEAVRLEVFAVSGRRVRTVPLGPRPAGTHSFVWNGLDDRGAPVPSGVYFVRVSCGGSTAAQKLLVVR